VRFFVDRIRGSSLYALTVRGAGFSGTVHSPATRIDGLVGLPELLDGNVEGGGHANVAKLRSRLDHGRRNELRVRILLGIVLITLALFAPRRALVGLASAIGGALVLSALGWTSLTLLALLTLVGTLLPRRALWLFFAAYLVVLVASPATQSLALLGPHPWGGGRFYGISNELETMLLAPALLLGVAAAPLVLVTVGWSKAGADGGGILVLLAAYAWLLPRPRHVRAKNRLVLAGGAAVVALGLVLVGLDAATGGHSHVTNALGGGPGRVAHDLWHRWGVSWHGATGTPGRVVQCVICLAVLGWVATRRPRVRIVDALLVGLAVSLVANDTPQDVLFWGAVAAVALRRAVYAQRPMRRTAPLLAVLLLFVAAGCNTSKPGEKTAQPLPSTVIGKVPVATTPSTTVPAIYKNGDATAGKQVFETAGCKGCHTLADAGATGTVGPNLDQVKPPLSIAVERVTKGKGAMPSFKGQLTDKQIADVTAYVVKATGGNPNG
jgi:mono/diheme cytochrome c family protein